MILGNEIFDYIVDTKPVINGELWLTDSVNLMRLDGKRVLGDVFSGIRYDIGTFESLIEADKL